MSIVASQLDGHSPSSVLSEHRSCLPVKILPSTIATEVCIHKAVSMDRRRQICRGPTQKSMVDDA